MKKLKAGSYCSLLIAGSLAISNVAHAQVTSNYDFGILVGGNPYAYYLSAPNHFASNPFAHLTIAESGTGCTSLEIATGCSEYWLNVNNNFYDNFGVGSYLRSISFDYTPTPSPQPVSSLLGSNVQNMTAISYNGSVGWTGTAIVLDFGTAFGMVQNGGHAGEGDNVHWKVYGLGSNYTLKNTVVKVGNISLGGGNYASYAAIPEPETYAMLLAGLGLFGFTARHRKQKGLK